MNRKIIQPTSTLGFLSSLTLLMVTSMMGCQKSADHTALPSNSKLSLRSVASTTIATTTTISLGNGVNLQPSYYCSGDENLGWPLMNQYAKITTVRIELDPSTSSTISDFARWISEAIANGKKVIATFHEYGGSDSVTDIMTAANCGKLIIQR
jgi:hypothetical protein